MRKFWISVIDWAMERNEKVKLWIDMWIGNRDMRFEDMNPKFMMWLRINFCYMILVSTNCNRIDIEYSDKLNELYMNWNELLEWDVKNSMELRLWKSEIMKEYILQQKSLDSNSCVTLKNHQKWWKSN